MLSSIPRALVSVVAIIVLLSHVHAEPDAASTAPEGVANVPLGKPDVTLGHSHADLELQHYRYKRYIENDIFDRVARVSQKVSTCSPAYKKYPGHTMCMADLPNIINRGLKPGAAAYIVREHNRYRSIVQPPAADLPKMVWSKELARVAQKWANQCVLAHDQVRTIPEFGQFVGQNVAAGHKGWGSAMKAWYDEIKLYKYGRDPKVYIGKDCERKIGHFTQMVTNSTVLIGCGFSTCSYTKFTRYFVCNYLAGQSQLEFPYTKGPRCSKCPNTCKKGVCDCGGKFCRNRGKLNLNTCQCECTSLYQGDTCTETVCPPSDAAHCTTQWKPALCKKYVNVPVECPYMCGLCTDKDKKKFEVVPRGSGIKVKGKDFFKSNYGCPFFGVRPSTALCKTYGNHGQDKPYGCASSGGKFDCKACLQFSNVATEYCPVMCGLCEGPCSGKTCQNNGVLNLKSCQCKCSPPYEGELCEKVNCPKFDRADCRSLKTPDCKRFYNVPGICPRMCGICK